MSATFLLVPGAGGAGWYWHRVVDELRRRGHRAEALDLPADDEQAGLADYAEVIIAAGVRHEQLVLVAQSLGGFPAAMAAEKLRPSRMVLLNAMIPKPGETPGAWGDNVGSSAARIAAAQDGGYSTEFSDGVYFLHDVPPEVVADGERHERKQTMRPFDDACTFSEWAAPVRVLAGHEDRLFPVSFQQKVARERLGVAAEAVPGGHLAALSYPAEVTDALLRD